MEPITISGVRVLALFDGGKRYTQQQICDATGYTPKKMKSILRRLRAEPNKKLYAVDYVMQNRKPVTLYAAGGKPDCDRDRWNETAELNRMAARREYHGEPVPADHYITAMVRSATQ